MGLHTRLSGWGSRGFADSFPPGGLLNQTGRDASHLGAKSADLGSEFQETGMIEWGQKLKPQKILRGFQKTPQKIPGPKFNTPKIPCRISEP